MLYRMVEMRGRAAPPSAHFLQDVHGHPYPQLVQHGSQFGHHQHVRRTTAVFGIVWMRDGKGSGGIRGRGREGG